MFHRPSYLMVSKLRRLLNYITRFHMDDGSIAAIETLASIQPVRLYFPVFLYLHSLRPKYLSMDHRPSYLLVSQWRHLPTHITRLHMDAESIAYLETWASIQPDPIPFLIMSTEGLPNITLSRIYRIE